MNGHIVGYSPFKLKLRNGKTWRWIQTWAKCTGRAKENHERNENAPAFASSADLLATPRDAGRILSGVHASVFFAIAHSRKIVFEVSSEPRSGVRGHSSHGGRIGPHTAPSPRPPPRQPVWQPPPPQLAGAAASGTIPRDPGRMQRRRQGRSGSKQAAARASQSLLRCSAPTHPVLRIIAQLDFLAQAPGYLHSCRARAGAGLLNAGRLAGGETDGGGAGRKGGASLRPSRRALTYARARARASNCVACGSRLRNGSGAEVHGEGRSGGPEP